MSLLLSRAPFHRRAVVLLLLLVVVGGNALAQAPSPDNASAETIEVPGGRRAISMLVGEIDERPDRFVTSLSYRLLEQPVPEQGWIKHYDRWRVGLFIAGVRRLLDNYGPVVEVSLFSNATRAQTLEVFHTLGYGITIDPMGRQANFSGVRSLQTLAQQEIAWALEWDMVEALAALNRGESVTLEIPVETANASVPLSIWSEIQGAPVDEKNALLTLVRNENTSRVLEAYRRMDPETARWVQPHLAWIRQNAAASFSRYSGALVAGDQSEVLKGGQQALDQWHARLGVSGQDPDRFLLALFDPLHGSRLAHDWHNSVFGPPSGPDLPLEQTRHGKKVSATHPFALEAVDGFQALTPAALDGYLESVVFLDERPRETQQLAVITAFQAGIELLRLLERSGKVPADSIAESFDRWTAIHRQPLEPGAITGEQVRWLGQLIESLPQAGPAEPGRSPAERRLLAALSPRRDPVAFRFMGLDFAGTRHRDLARRMEYQLEVHAIPTPDALLVLNQRLDAAQRAAAAGQLAETQRLVRSVSRALRPIDAGQPAPTGTDPALAEFLQGVDRGELLQFLARTRVKAKKRQLRRIGEGLAEAKGVLIRPLRHLLVGLVYCSAVGELDNFFFEERNLVERHTTLRRFGSQARQGMNEESAWLPAELVPSRESIIGARIAGHVAGSRRVLAPFARIPGQKYTGGVITDSSRRSTYLQGVTNTRWEKLTPAVSRAIASLLRQGRNEFEQVIETQRRAPGDVPADVLARIPRVRLMQLAAAKNPAEQASTSELFLLGVRAQESRGRAPEGLGPDWKAAVGVGVVGADGRVHRDNPWSALRLPYAELVAARDYGGLYNRELIDLRLRITRFLARRGLPGRVGSDLLVEVLLADGLLLDQLEAHDWPGAIDWIRQVTDRDLREGLRRCLKKGHYRLR